MAHGTDLEAAVTYLLEGNVSSEEHARQLLGSAASLPQIDITPEMAQLQQAKVCSSSVSTFAQNLCFWAPMGIR